VKLSIVILCWNDLKLIGNCLQSIYSGTHSTEFEVIVSDNGSSDTSVEFIRANFPQVRVLENAANLRFSKGNNVGIEISTGEYVLILNPDTIIHDGALDRLIEFADRHPEAGGFGCRVLNTDGSYQGPARPFPTIWREWLAALYLRPLGYLSDAFISDKYVRWHGETERAIDWQSGCCVLVRADLLKQIGGFDERFYYYYEDVDLCHRIWDAGYPILYTPAATITHLGGQSSSGRFPIPFELDKYRNRYRYFYKHFGQEGARQCRHTSLAWLWVRRIAYTLVQVKGSSDALKRRLELYRVAAEWNRRVDPVQLVENGKEPETAFRVPDRVPQ
jgi:N-acetylglucosaminyl-diphospho-decaprenol L-rhamnosyltransferase